MSARIPARLPRAATLLAAAALVSACASAKSESSGDTVGARPVAGAPALDGSTDEPAWRDAAWLLVHLDATNDAPHGPHEAWIAAVTSGDTIYVAVRWPDAAEDRSHKPWVRSDEGWKAGPDLEDVLAVGFPISGEFTGSMTSPVECVWDVWHWKAARTDPAGFAMDKSHVHTFTDPKTKGHDEKLPDGRTLHIRRPEDAGTSATRPLKAPAGATTGSFPQYEAIVPTGSAGDVRARGAWKDGWWTVELSRKLDTGHADDAPFARGGMVPFAIAILDHAVDEHHTASGKLSLAIEERNSR